MNGKERKRWKQIETMDNSMTTMETSMNTLGKLLSTLDILTKTVQKSMNSANGKS